ncbi:MAG: UDP-2,4-diacetamido-2,4,6-trideoxy-beta-L-altropyranose hydrolase [Syntrophus sp. (in: bacteria)]
MNLYIRADADSKIGIGHVMRCFALAQAWQDQGAAVTFISCCESALLKQRVQNEGFNFIPLGCACPDPEDLKSTLSLLRMEGAADPKDWFVLDGYHFTPDYQKAIYEAGMHLMVIDDMNHLASYHADMILNQNSHAHKLIYNCPEGTTVLQGIAYVFLRREFLEYRNRNRVIPVRAKKILVSFGGADPDNVTYKVIKSLQLLGELDMEITVVVGPANAHKDNLHSTLESSGLSYKLLINPSNMVDIMADVDLAISAGGGTFWELAYMGVPCLMVILAENQREVAEELGKVGIVMNLGWHNLLSSEDIARAIRNMVVSDQARRDMLNEGQSLINGEGANLMISAMKSYAGRGSQIL